MEITEFQLNADRYGKHASYKLWTFAKGYVGAMFFTNSGRRVEDLLDHFSVEKLTARGRQGYREGSDAFLRTIMPDGCFVRQ